MQEGSGDTSPDTPAQSPGAWRKTRVQSRVASTQTPPAGVACMAGDSAACVEMEQPPIRGEDDCDANSVSSWESIFAVAPAAGAPPPGLGVNFMRATQHTITAEYTMATVDGKPRRDNQGEERAMLTLGQDLLQRGLGAVVWDCVSVVPGRIRL